MGAPIIAAGYFQRAHVPTYRCGLTEQNCVFSVTIGREGSYHGKGRRDRHPSRVPGPRVPVLCPGEMSCRCSELQRTVSPVPSAAPPQVLTKMVSFLQNSFPEALDRPVGFNFKQHGTLPRRLGTIRKETQAVQPRGSAATLRCIVETLALFSQVGGPRWGAGATKGLSAAHPRDDGCGLRYTVALEYNEHTQYVSVFTL